VAAADLLVRSGADVRLACTDRHGFSLLHLAAFSGNPDMIDFVLSL
jgi:hypothetical protein